MALNLRAPILIAFSIGLTVWLAGCADFYGGRAVAPNEFVELALTPASGVQVEKKIGNFSYKASYQPIQLLALREIGGDLSSIPARQFDSLETLYAGMRYFNFQITNLESGEEPIRANLEDESEYERRVKYFAFEAQRDAQLIYGLDTLPCALFHFERSYNQTPYLRFSLAFPLESIDPKAKQLTLSWNDRIFGAGPIWLNFDPRELAKLDQLKITTSTQL